MASKLPLRARFIVKACDYRETKRGRKRERDELAYAAAEDEDEEDNEPE